MKRIIQITLAATLFLLSASFIFAAEVSVIIDGKQVEFTQESGRPFIDENNRTQTPFRQTLEAFGATVDWEPATRTAVAEKNGIIVRVPIGTNYIYKNDLMIVNDTTSMIVNNRTYLPIRIVLEAFGADVSWDSANRAITVSSDGETISLAVLAAQVEAAMAQIYSMNVEAISYTVATVGEETGSQEMIVAKNLFIEPLEIKMTYMVVYGGEMRSIFVHDGEEETTVEMYVFQDGNDVIWIAYDRFMGGYVRFLTHDINEGTYMRATPFVAWAITSLNVAERTSINNIPVLKLDGTISVEMYEKFFTDINLEEQRGIDIDVVDIKIPMTMWIDLESKVIMSYKMDLTEYAAFTFYARGDVGVTLYTMTFEVTISNINNATKFVIPEELSNDE